MTKESDKILLPHFDQASPPPSAVTDAPPLQQEQTFPSDRDTTFYGAAYNLLSSFFKNGFAPTVGESSFYMGCSVDDDVFRFTLIPKPDDKHSASDVHDCVSSFIYEICNVVHQEELDIAAFHTPAPHENGFTIKTTSSRDLMDLLNNLLKPYEITLGLCFNSQAIFRTAHEPVSFAMSPLYSLEHVRALYLHSKGVDCKDLDLGLQLSH